MKALSVNELIMSVKQSVIKSSTKPSKYVHGVFNIYATFSNGTYIHFFENAEGKESYIRIGNMFENVVNSDYARMNTTQRKVFADYLAFRMMQECVSPTGFRWIQEIGADKTSAQFFNEGQPMTIKAVSQPFYLL